MTTPYPSDRLFPGTDTWPARTPPPPPPPVVAPGPPHVEPPGVMRDRWSFVVGPATGGLVTELAAARSRKLTFKLRDAHEASLELDGTDPAAEQIRELATDVHAFRRPAAGQPRERMFRGRIANVGDNISETAHTVSVPALDYRAVLERRHLMSGSTVAWANTDQAAIAYGLISQVQRHPGGDYGIRPRIGATTGVRRDRTYDLGDSVGTRLKELSEVTDGFDYEIATVDDTALALDIYYPQRGTDRGVVIEVGGAARTVQRDVDSKEYANHIRLTGQQPEGGGDEPPPVERVAPNPAAAPEGRWDAVYGESITTLANLNERADWRIGQSQVVTPSYTVALRPGWWRGPNHVWLGDPVRLVIYRGRLRVDTVLRVHEVAVTIPDNADEQVSLTLGAPAPDYRRRASDVERRLSELERR